MHIGKQEIPQYHLELVRDRSTHPKFVVGTFNSADVLHSMLDTSPVEQFVAIYVNSDGNMVGAEQIAMGDLEHVGIGMRNLFRGALMAAVPRIIMGHNHPHGKAYPSDPDLTITALAIQAGAIVGIEVLDHIIVAPDGTHFSMWDNQQEMVDRVTQISIERHLQEMIGKHALVEPLLQRANKEDFTNLLLDRLERLTKPRY